MDSRTGENQERSKYDSAIDLFSLLPEDLVLDILSYLPPSDVARSSVLSKSWHQVWNSIPTENFHFCYDGRRDSNAINNFINSVDDSLQEFRGRQITKIKSFFLCLPIPYAEEFPCLDDWIGLVTHHCIQELQICIDFAMIKFPRAIFQAKSLSVLRLQGFTMRGTVLGGDITLPCLKILSLSGVYNSDLMTEKFLSSCPSLEQFSILASDLKNLHISNLPKLKKVEAEVSHKIHIEGLNIQILRCTIFRSSGLELEELHCNNLKELSVQADITNYWIQQLFEKFHLLEFLHLKSFQLCQRVFISSHRLKRLSLDLNTRPEVLDINAPNLKSLTYRGETLPCLCRMNTSSPQIAKMGIDATKEFIGRAWFLRLKNYLGLFHNHELLALSVYSNEISFNPTKWTDKYRPQPCRLERMEIIHVKSAIIRNYSALLDGLLCCAPPRILQFKYLPKHNSELIKFFYETLITNKEENQQCPFNCNQWCWRHILKDVKIKIQKHNGVEQTGEFVSLQNLECGDLVIFEFTWLNRISTS